MELHVTQIREKIYLLRGVEVMLDSDLAELYEVDTKRINEAVHRNPEKFPDDFMFECSEEEWESLRSHFATLKDEGRGQHRKYAPKAFSEQGVYMLEESFDDFKEMVSEIGAAKEVEAIGFLRGSREI